MRTRAALPFLVLAALAACGTTHDPKLPGRYAALRQRVERDREEIDRQIQALPDLEPAVRSRRLTQLDEALSTLFDVQARALDASYGDDADALAEATKTLEGVERTIRSRPSPR